MFAVSWEPPSAAADIARQRAWLAPAPDDISACPALARVIQDYGGSSDARRALLDIAGAYGRAGEWQVAEAPFRYVMEVREGHSEARIAHFRLIEMYRYARATPPVDPITECRRAVDAYAGTPEEGLGRMLLGDMLAEREECEAAFAEFQRVLDEFPDQPYSAYARIRYAVGLSAAGQTERAIEIVSPVLEDPLWRGRAHWAHAKAYAAQGATDKAIGDYLIAARYADSLWLRGECYLSVAQLCDRGGNRSQGSRYLHACLEICPNHPKHLQIRLDLAERSFEQGLYAEAAQAALELATEVEHSVRYSEAEVSEISSSCNELLDKCERRLAARFGARLAGREEGPPLR